jgi:amino acid transporter
MSVTDKVPRQRNFALKREVGLIGLTCLTWASMGSIIGSGWLFAPQEALEVAGPAVLISWLIPYLVGMGLILFFSDFGPKGDDALIPFGGDMVVVAAWSLVVYYWAMEVALPTEMIEEMIGEVELPQEDMQVPTH